jgi:hypothetical protein
MVRKKRPQIPPTPRIIKTDTSNLQGILETVQNSLFDITNEIAKVQPRYAQSVSNFQAEYLEATRMVIQTFGNFQSTLMKFSWIDFDTKSSYYTDQIKNQVAMFTENIIKTCDIWNQITLDSIDISKENMKIYTEAMTSMDIQTRYLISSYNSYLIPTYRK